MTVYEDEIDLRPYILTIIQHWWQIVIVAVLLAALALAYSLMQPRQYESSANICDCSRSTNLAQQFPTVNDPIDTRTRLDAILAIAESDAAVTQVIQALGDDLPPELREVEPLKNVVHFTNKGDIIQVTAAAEDPVLASKIANTWAQQALLNINTAYSGQQPLAEIQNQAKTTRGEYEQSQAR
jgi:uncharacterized protein involved in exopolysaccharide biosynthesis